MPTKGRLSVGRFLALTRTPHPRLWLPPSMGLESLGRKGSSELLCARILSWGGGLCTPHPTPRAGPWGRDAGVPWACFQDSNSPLKASFMLRFKKKETHK